METHARMKRPRLALWGLVGTAVLAIACGLPSDDAGSSDAGSLPVDPGMTGGADGSTGAPAEPTLPTGTITAKGELLVGTDIKAGTYRGVGCGYWARLKNADGDLDSIRANGNVDSGEHLTVTIAKTDYAFDNSCTALMPISYLRTVPKSKVSKEFGTLVVGKDIHPGTWRGTAIDDCYWARLSGFTGDLGSILANDNVKPGAKFTINVKTSDKGLELDSDCGELAKVG